MSRNKDDEWINDQERQVPKVTIDVVYVDADPKGARSARKPKFRDMDNPFQTWSGFGKRPRWLRQRLEQGFDIEQFRIEVDNEN